MNRKAILLIIGLMSAALVGIAVLQVNWIRYAISLNEKKFDKSVRDALVSVADRLEEEQELVAFSSINGYGTSYFQQREVIKDQGGSVKIDISRSQIMQRWSENNCTCSRCQAERLQDFNQLQQWANFTDQAAKLPIAERISPDRLNTFLEQEMMDRGIESDYNFGVFSRDKNSFVIIDDHYVVEDATPKEFLPGYENLYNSKYYVSLFPKEQPNPGFLMIHFPNKATVVWGDVWKNLLGSILFTGIILFCFIYTILVIFRQKKLGEMKTDFINNMTHEFKTPIATISLAADSITSPMISSNVDKVKRFAGIIKQENRRMNAQVEKVLQMAAIDKRDFNLSMTEVDLHDVIRTAVQNIGLQVEKKDGRAYAELEAKNSMVQGDQTHISNMINNLLDNANKYSPEKPVISVHTRNISSGVEVTIKDNGIGMTKEARKHIFNKFYRVHTGDIHDVKGFGLGLSYVKAMMTAHKGTIDVKSELGKGSSFILFFPYRVEE
ncbi:MAG: sensor histidine kinase [Saprospiraceae bacterium]